MKLQYSKILGLRHFGKTELDRLFDLVFYETILSLIKQSQEDLIALAQIKYFFRRTMCSKAIELTFLYEHMNEFSFGCSVCWETQFSMLAIPLVVRDPSALFLEEIC